VAEPQHLLGGVEKLGEQLPLPAVPDARTDRADIDHGQHQHEPQPLGRLNDLGEIEHRLEVGEVALEGGIRHQQMVAHQPGDRLRLGRAHPEAGTELLRDLRAEDTVIAAPALGDVVEQHRDIEHAARHDLVDHGGRDRMILGKLALLDPRQ
jgi:hypothetical protein